jgi:FSR family fosmidomycin resistance protein-like MFS transporter
MKEKTRILTTVSIYHAINDGSIVVVTLLFPIFRTLFNLSYTQIGLLTGLGLLTNLITQLFIGHTADGKNSNTLLSTGTILISFSLLLLTQSKNFALLLTFILLLRISTSFFHPIGTGWISRIYKKENIDHAMGIQSGFADIGAFLATVTTLYLANIYSWDFPLLIWSVMAALGAIIGIFITRHLDEKLCLVNILHTKKRKLRVAKDFYNSLKQMKFLIPAFIVSGAAWGVTITFLPFLLVERTTLSLAVIGVVVSVWIGIGSITSFFYSNIKALIGRRTAITLAYLTIGVVGLGLAYFTHEIFLLIFMILLGVSVFITYPALASFISEVTHESSEGRTFGLVFTLQLGGGTIISFISGVFSDYYGIWSPFLFLGILSTGVFFLFIINHKNPIITKISTN